MYIEAADYGVHLKRILQYNITKASVRILYVVIICCLNSTTFFVKLYCRSLDETTCVYSHLRNFNQNYNILFVLDSDPFFIVS